MYQLDSPYYLYLLIIIPFLLIINIIYLVWRKKTQENFSSSELLEKLSPNRSNFKIKLKMIFEILAILFIIIALVNPKIGTELKTVKREGVDIVFALDISKSMLAEDVAPNRLQKSKRLISEIINSLGSDRVGIIVYAEQAVPQVPLTTDFASVTYDSERSGTYTKIGNRVFISFRMKTDAVDNSPASGSVNIQGLPFTASSHVTADGGVSIGYNSGFTTKYPTGGYITGGSTTLNLVYWGSGNDTTALDVGNVATGANSNIMTCHGHYFV